MAGVMSYFNRKKNQKQNQKQTTPQLQLLFPVSNVAQT